MSDYFGRKTTWDDHLVIKAGDRNAPKFHDFTVYHKHPHFVRGFLNNFSSPKGNCHVESIRIPLKSPYFSRGPGGPGAFPTGLPGRLSQPFPGHFWDNATVSDPWSLGPTYSGAGGEACLGPAMVSTVGGDIPWRLGTCWGNHGFYVFFMDFHGCFMLVFFL